MSESSESYHLRANSTAEGIALLERAGIDGFVLPPLNGWVTILAEGVYLMPNRALIEANQGLLLHTEIHDEHGWGFEIYNGLHLANRYLMRVDSEASVDSTQFDTERLAAFLRDEFAHPDPKPELDALFDSSPDLELFGFQPQAVGFLRLIGLEERMWLSYQDWLLGFDPQDPEVEGSVRVGPA